MPNVIEIAREDESDRFAIVVAEWNRSITDRLLDGALEVLGEAAVVDVAWVPGAWELPVAVQRLAQSQQYAAILALGAVIHGETSHDQHINRGVSLALMKIALSQDLPVLLGLLTCDSMEQAIHRAGGNVGNKGSECAQAALKMVGLLRNCPPG
ncbi:MAG: 6,7-dimethyl-8-ribityllumazine synthase [Pirellulales bacterium]|nr:6,7-dimethyl-8-ribityllumazine synthase [Pirellulales bacterium]